MVKEKPRRNLLDRPSQQVKVKFIKNNHNPWGHRWATSLPMVLEEILSEYLVEGNAGTPEGWERCWGFDILWTMKIESNKGSQRERKFLQAETIQ